MAARKPKVRQGPVLVIDRAFGLTGIRKAANVRTLPGGIALVDASAGADAIPETVVPTEIHVAFAGPVVGVAQAEKLVECVDELMERAGMAGHAHYNVPRDEKTKPHEPLRQECRCGSTRTRERGPHAWGAWS